MKPDILVVDDHEHIRSFLKAFLSKEFNVIEAKDGYEALTILAHSKIKVVLLDIMMPHLNGHQTLFLIRSLNEFAGIKVALMSAKDKEDGTTLAGEVEHQADIYFNKPMKMSEVLDWVRAQF